MSARGGEVDGPAGDRVPASGEQLVPELRAYHRQLTTIEGDTRLLLEGLTDLQLAWRENVKTWSVADCLNHLLVTGHHSLASIRRTLVDARSRGLLSRGPYRHGVLGNWFIRLMDAPPTIKFKAPKAYRPALGVAVSDIVTGFFVLQHDLVRVLEEADGIDLARARVSNPVSMWLTMSLGQEFALTAAHERRHLWQAWMVRARLLSAADGPRDGPELSTLTP